jgi:iron complex transport system substrate-binding protein
MSKRSGLLRPSRLAVPLAVLALSVALTACGGSEDDGSAPVVEPSASGAFPVTIENKFGTTEIPAEPQRVVTVGFNDQDFVLALGVTPVGERENLGEYDATTRPWAEELLPAEDIPTVGGEEINLEAVAAL